MAQRKLGLVILPPTVENTHKQCTNHRKRVDTKST
jgi:hypothetical protein